ncbi:MAG: hypothetical protein IJ735_03380 [Clostridia bacterium]|nr:hypothetical protein [Clostridia bacterium]
MAKKKNVQHTVIKGNVEMKGAPASKAFAYSSFGWVRAKGPAPEGTKIKTKEQVIALKRRAQYGQDPQIRAYENEYLQRDKKRYRQLPILGILCFLLMLVFLAVAGVELYYGISQGLDRVKYENTYNFYDENGEKLEYPLFELTKDAWAYRTSGAETPEMSGTIKNAVTTLEFYNATESEDEEAELIFIVYMNRGTLKILDAPSNAMKGQVYFSEKSRPGDKFSIAKVEEEQPASAPSNADEEVDEDEEGEETAEASGGFLDKIVGILDKVHDDYIVKVTGIFDGKVTETTVDEEGEVVPAKGGDGFLSNLATSMGAPIGCFISGDTVVALIALILFVIVTCFFAAIAKKKSKRRQNEARKAELQNAARQRLEEMRRSNPALMNKMERKAYMWENILTNALRNAGVGGSGPVSDDEEEFDFD